MPHYYKFILLDKGNPFRLREQKGYQTIIILILFFYTKKYALGN